MNVGDLAQPTFASFCDFYDGAEFRQDQLRMQRALARQAGFEIQDVWGGHDSRPLAPGSRNMIFVARKQ